MLSIKNMQPEPIRIVYNGKKNIVESGGIFAISDTENITITLERCDFSTEATAHADKVIGAVAKSCVLMMNSTYHFNEIGKNASAIVRNGAYEHSTSDFGYLYFDVIADECSCKLSDCEIINRQEVLRAQRIIRLGEGYDFPPFSIISALLKYSKIKKMCSKDKVFSFLTQKHDCNNQQ